MNIETTPLKFSLYSSFQWRNMKCIHPCGEMCLSHSNWTSIPLSLVWFYHSLMTLLDIQPPKSWLHDGSHAIEDSRNLLLRLAFFLSLHSELSSWNSSIEMPVAIAHSFANAKLFLKLFFASSISTTNVWLPFAPYVHNIFIVRLKHFCQFRGCKISHGDWTL